jgi:hypothetical protein
LVLSEVNHEILIEPPQLAGHALPLLFICPLVLFLLLLFPLSLPCIVSS